MTIAGDPKILNLKGGQQLIDKTRWVLWLTWESHEIKLYCGGKTHVFLIGLLTSPDFTWDIKTSTSKISEVVPAWRWDIRITLCT